MLTQSRLTNRREDSHHCGVRQEGPFRYESGSRCNWSAIETPAGSRWRRAPAGIDTPRAGFARFKQRKWKETVRTRRLSTHAAPADKGRHLAHQSFLPSPSRPQEFHDHDGFPDHGSAFLSFDFSMIGRYLTGSFSHESASLSACRIHL